MGVKQSKEQQQAQSNEQNQIIQPDPLIKNLRRHLKLHTVTSNQDFHYSRSFLHREFTKQINKNTKGKINQKFSPFCSIFIGREQSKTKQVFTCAIISPIMALVPSHQICNQKGVFYQDLQVIGYGKVVKKMAVKSAYKLSSMNLGLLIFQQPHWQLGWTGLMYFLTPSKLPETIVYQIDHYFQKSEKNQADLKDRSPVNQRMQRVHFNINEYRGKGSTQANQLLLTIHQAKSYLIGLQTKDQCFFFTTKMFQQVQERAKMYLRPHVERQILKKIDILTLQMESEW